MARHTVDHSGPKWITPANVLAALLLGLFVMNIWYLRSIEREVRLCGEEPKAETYTPRDWSALLDATEGME